MTIGGYAGMVAAAPLGALVDATHAKRAIMIVLALTISVASMAILFMPSGDGSVPNRHENCRRSRRAGHRRRCAVAVDRIDTADG
jgi:predicted MFS family arabinose efflux permease